MSLGKFGKKEFIELIHVDENGCWIWEGSTNSTTGYGMYRSHYAHRFSYEFHRGDIPSGLTIDHLCRVRNCVNPDHLEAVTLRENILRSNNAAAQTARRSACDRGHEYVEGSFRWANYAKRGNPYRFCIICDHEKQKEYRRTHPRVRNRSKVAA